MTSNYKINEFSANQYYSDSERKCLEEKFFSKLEILGEINRKEVSFQLSKNNGVSGWFKYREGFSSNLVEFFLNKIQIDSSSIILDPFFGSGTTGYICQHHNVLSYGIDILPTSALVTEIKNNIHNVDLAEIDSLLNDIKGKLYNKKSDNNLPYIRITEHAYPESVDTRLSFLRNWKDNNQYGYLTNSILNLAILNSLEGLSYTNKDGQYLRWDIRSHKIQLANAKRIEQGKGPIKNIFNKGQIPDTYDTIISTLSKMREDIIKIKNNLNINENLVKFYHGSSLDILPTIPNNYFSGVITSPPYCNRYDYTRTYALELAYLGYDDSALKELRQSLLTCTVENKDKSAILLKIYKRNNRENDFYKVDSLIKRNKVFCEIISALEKRSQNGDLNNKNIVRMVYGYFYELAFIYFEIFRTCKPGAKIFFVNDNVRYGGEVIPVDFLSSDIAEEIGFKINRIYSIEQKKGNSSQQMKKFGKISLRKSITEWEIPHIKPPVSG